MVCLHGSPQSPSFCHMELHYAWRLFPRFNRQQQTNLEQRAATEWHWTDPLVPSFLSFPRLPLAALCRLLLVLFSLVFSLVPLFLALLILPLPPIACCILNAHCLSSQRVPSLFPYCLRGLYLAALERSSPGQKYLALCFWTTQKRWRNKPLHSKLHSFMVSYPLAWAYKCVWRSVSLHVLWRLTLCHKHLKPTITIWSCDW